MMTAIGTLAGAGVIPLWQTIIWAILGAIVGDGISYWIGRHFNERLPGLWPFKKYPTLLERAEIFFRKHGPMSVFIGRFIGPIRALVPLVAGMLGMRPLRFYIANILSAIAWAPVYMLPGILLGAASLELPPDIAVHVIFMLLMTAFFIMLCVWLIQRLLKLIGRQIDQALTWIWNRLDKSSYFHSLTSLLKHHDSNRLYGQLVSTFYFIVLCCAFLYLSLWIHFDGSQNVTINTIVFHFFRSIRTPHLDTIMLAITFFGEKKVLLPVIAILFCRLARIQKKLVHGMACSCTRHYFCRQCFCIKTTYRFTQTMGISTRFRKLFLSKRAYHANRCILFKYDIFASGVIQIFLSPIFLLFSDPSYSRHQRVTTLSRRSLVHRCTGRMVAGFHHSDIRYHFIQSPERYTC